VDKNLNINVTGSSKSAEDAINRIDGRLQALATGLAAGFSTALFNRIFSGLEAIADGFKQIVERGIQFNATVQDATLGVAAVIKQFDDTGKIKNFDDALALSTEALNQLKIEARQSPATLQQLVSAFQAISGAALGAGVSLKDTVSLTTLMSQALAGLGIRSEQIIQESRALITGNINEDAAAAKILGITKAQIDLAKEQGQLFEFLSDKLGAFKEAASRGTENYTTALSNLEDAIDAVAGEATEDLFEVITESILSLSEAIADPNFQAGLKPFIDDLTRLVKVVSEFGDESARNLDKVGEFYDKAKLVLSLYGTGDLFSSFMPKDLLTEETLADKFTEGFSKGIGKVTEAFGGLNEQYEKYLKFEKQAAVTSNIQNILLEAGKVLSPKARKTIEDYQDDRFEPETVIKKADVGSLTDSQEKLVYAISREIDKMNASDSTKLFLDFIEKAQILQKEFTKNGKDFKTPFEEDQYYEAYGKLEQIYLANAQKIKDAEDKRRAEALEAEDEFLDQLRAEEETYSNDKEERINAETELLKRHIRERITDVEKLQQALEIADRIRARQLETETARIYELSEAYERFANGAKRNLGSLAESWSDLGTNVSNVLVNGIQAGVRGVGDTIGDAIYTTANWERTFARVGQSIVRSLINVVVEYIAQMTVVRALRRIMDTEQVVSAGVRTAAEAPAAAAASIGSWGAAVPIGIAALLAGVAVGIAAFKDGGTVKGGKQIIQVNEQGQEFVVNARATAALGEDFLYNLQAAAERGQNFDQVMTAPRVNRQSQYEQSSGKAPTVNVAAAPVYVAVVHDTDAVLNDLRSTQGRKQMYEITKEQAVQLGIQT
jgi:hypothetical protein